MENTDLNENNSDKIQSLREMIYAAEKTLQGAKSMLLQLEGKKKVGRKKKNVLDNEKANKIIEGTFDGQIMIGTDGKQYPVPANYASKSKLVEGDVLKLTITPDGSFVYKQIGPIERKRFIGTVYQDGEGNYFVLAENKPFHVLLASITYFKVTPGDDVTLIVPRDIDSDWGTIENVLLDTHDKKIKEDAFLKEEAASKKNQSVIEEWLPNLEDLKKEFRDDREKTIQA